MTTATGARDAVLNAVNVAWLASGTTSGIAILWGDVAADAVGHDADGNALPWARASTVTISSTRETNAGPGSRKHLTEGILTVQIFTPSGDGHALEDLIVEVLKPALRSVSIGDLWFGNVVPREIGTDGPWFNTNLVAEYRYVEFS